MESLLRRDKWAGLVRPEGRGARHRLRRACASWGRTRIAALVVAQGEEQWAHLNQAGPQLQLVQTLELLVHGDGVRAPVWGVKVEDECRTRRAHSRAAELTEFVGGAERRFVACLALSPELPSGVIVGGLDQGVMTIYDAQKLLSGDDNPVVFSKNKHTGPVQALDFNPFQPNLLASGASESEIFIWDMNKLTAPMTPGSKSQPPDDVRCVAWNKQVQHILASSFASRCVVWDLRKNDPIIKVSDSTSRMRTKVVAWHPEVATQLCLASEDDHTPVIQIWDLRLASSPIRTLESHQRGILSVAWCDQDSDLLLSCGKDNRILCWNPNSTQPGGEVLCELASSSQWSFDVSWCPRNPAVIASSSFDGHVSVYSLMGGQQQAQPTTAIADSFPGMEAMQPVAQTGTVTMQLKKPPKWLKKPCAARFGFGGRLVSVETERAPANAQQPLPPKSSVFLSKVITEQEFVDRSTRLETSIQSQNLPEFCDSKISSASQSDEQEVWRFIKANFGDNPRLDFLDLLGYNPEQVTSLVEATSGVKVVKARNDPVNDLANDLGNLDSTLDKEGAFEAIAANADLNDTLESEVSRKPFKIDTGESPSGLLVKTLLTGNIELAVELCLEQNRMADAIVLASQGGEELVAKTQKRYFSKCQSQESSLIQGVVTSDWRDFVERCEPSSWKEALVAVVTYASNEDFPSICTTLGNRIQGQAAMLCYICAGDLDQVVECWMKTKDTGSGPRALQDLVEVVMTLKNAIERIYGQVNIDSGPLSAKLTQYANLLAAQGALSAAQGYLGESDEESIAALRERLTGALGRRGVSQTQSSKFQQRPNRASVGQRSRQSSYGGGYSEPAQPAQSYAPPPSGNLYNPAQPSYGSGFSSGMDASAPNWNTQVSSAAPMVPSSAAAPPNIFNPAEAVPSSMAPPPAGMATASAGSYQPAGHLPDHGGPGFRPPSSNGSGWNDPPPMAVNSRSKLASMGTKTTSALSAVPITQPLLGGASMEAPPVNHANQYGIMNPANMAPPPSSNPMMGGSDPYNQGSFGSSAPPAFNPGPPPTSAYGGFNPQPPSMGGDPGGYGAPSAGYAQPPQGPPSNFMTPAPVDPPANMMTPTQFQHRAPGPSGSLGGGPSPPGPPQEKLPIPAEHQELQDVFESLRTKCLSAANHPVSEH
eukprot:maker-scaffold201_size263271-snap-gene-1.32 protein:Tk08051 transcript:maker-scaffold201_size263271-snap-gene-1.32-mRNA-1 annotation:"hypothetical protein CAPTEDRAFT_20326"